MISAIIQRDGEALSLTVQGHAGAGEPGHDLVCAAVSTAVTTLANLAIKEADATVTLFEGNAYIYLRKPSKAMRAHFQFVREVFRLLMEAHPDNVTFKVS